MGMGAQGGTPAARGEISAFRKRLWRCRRPRGNRHLAWSWAPARGGCPTAVFFLLFLIFYRDLCSMWFLQLACPTLRLLEPCSGMFAQEPHFPGRRQRCQRLAPGHTAAQGRAQLLTVRCQSSTSPPSTPREESQGHVGVGVRAEGEAGGLPSAIYLLWLRGGERTCKLGSPHWCHRPPRRSAAPPRPLSLSPADGSGIWGSQGSLPDSWAGNFHLNPGLGLQPLWLKRRDGARADLVPPWPYLCGAGRVAFSLSERGRAIPACYLGVSRLDPVPSSSRTAFKKPAQGS